MAFYLHQLSYLNEVIKALVAGPSEATACKLIEALGERAAASVFLPSASMM
jgi:hypothetical protein